MTTHTRSTTVAFVVAALSIVLAVVAGVAWLGTPLRLVHLVTIVGLSMSAGASWTQAVWRARHERSKTRPPSPPSSPHMRD